ncbi:MAG: hypothetical protein ACHP7J_00180 [Terriglobales bacterium]
MLKKHKGELAVECDECGTEAFGGTADFQQFIQDIKDQGWKIRKVDDEWVHKCPSCAEED